MDDMGVPSGGGVSRVPISQFAGDEICSLRVRACDLFSRGEKNQIILSRAEMRVASLRSNWLPCTPSSRCTHCSGLLTSRWRILAFGRCRSPAVAGADPSLVQSTGNVVVAPGSEVQPLGASEGWWERLPPLYRPHRRVPPAALWRVSLFFGGLGVALPCSWF